MIRLPIDTRKRICLSKFLTKKNIHSVLAHEEGDKIVLELMAEIPARDVWIHENPKADSVKKCKITKKQEKVENGN